MYIYIYIYIYVYIYICIYVLQKLKSVKYSKCDNEIARRAVMITKKVPFPVKIHIVH